MSKRAPLTAAQKATLETLYPVIAAKVLRKFGKKYLDRHDTILSAIGWGMVKAVKSFDPASGYTFHYHLEFVAFQQARSDLWKPLRDSKRLHLNPLQEWGEPLWYDRQRDDDLREVVNAYLDRMPWKARETILMSIVEDLSFSEIARRLGEKVSTISMRKTLGLRKLRQLLPITTKD